MTFTVEEKTWLRGKGPFESSLQNQHTGKRCCLGFRALATGLSETDITGRGLPDKFHMPTLDISKWPGLIEPEGNPTRACEKIAAVNDNQHLTDADRKSQLTKLFSEIGDEILFV